MARISAAGSMRIGILVHFFLSGVASAASAADGYMLTSQDKLRVSVSEISSATGEIRTRLSGDFTIDAAGDVAIPLLGNIKAAGLSAAQFATSISLQFQAKARLVNPPATAVELLQYRPIYLVGAVDKPGAYPYTPGMRVIHALSVAGGLARTPPTGQTRFERDAIQARGELGVLRAQRDKLEARRARLEATIAGKDTIEFPPSLQARSAEPNVRETMSREQLLFGQQHKTRALELAKYSDQLSLLHDQVDTLQNQNETQNQQISSVDREIANVRKLDVQGLATPGRLFMLERAAMAVDSKRKEIETEILKVRERIAANEASVKQLQVSGKELLAELNAVDSDLEVVTGRLRTVENLIRQLQVEEAAVTGQNEQEVETKYRILSERNGELIEEEASEASRVNPGDVIKVQLRTTGLLTDRNIAGDVTAAGYQ